MAGLRIGQVAQRAGVTTATIRYYERAGLLPKPPRSAAGYRLYAERAVEELLFIRRAQHIGFSLDEIRELLRLSRNGTAPCSRVIGLAEEHLAAVDDRIRQLETFRRELASTLRRWRNGEYGFTPGGLCDLITASAASHPRPRAAGLRRRPGQDCPGGRGC